ncbi:MAG TPA: HRDC domain-containing protein [Pyrinomonadaceae bacterium]|nr:HRDC domain-containing protein [Pyrinomonadaceae bacterium]
MSSDPQDRAESQADKSAYRVITDEAEARRALLELQRESVIGLDTETYWDTKENHSRVSLVQLAPRAGEILVIDLLEVEAEILRPLIESPEVIMAAHNARFDEGMLRGAGLRPAGFVDTLRLARSALRLPSYSLAGVSEHLFGIELYKRYQKSNWRRRPLTRAQLQYAALDARMTLELYDELSRILSEKGKLEAAIRFATLEPAVDKPASKERRRRAPQPLARPLTEDERRILKELKKWRLEKSGTEMIAAYMICQDRTLEHLAMEKPETLAALQSIYGLGASRISRYGEELLEALRKAQADL